ncbi:hypothetical protein RHGRI_023122 [Rhododendron griersonianum]|uniref:DSBA-like thioredoxin domain-containing protein n=1 Tax=Rhododendron griersonianum TaxID=479676 RepID=A0AAV6J651_9ERIC|nr:hypothetical protein RHGRI_023122 [Rhododendron griersonianum]
MAQAVSNNTEKKLIRIDISSDTVCPWCFVGKRNLDQAIASSKDQYDFEIKWHPYLLNPSAPKEGVNKEEFYKNKFGSRSGPIIARMTEVFRGLGLEYNISGLTGNTSDSHRLIYFAGQQGLDKQHNIVEELFLGYFTLGKYIGDRLELILVNSIDLRAIFLACCSGIIFSREFLLECARKVGVEGAAEFLEDPSNGLKEVNEELEKYSQSITGVPYYAINGKLQLSGGQPPLVFQRAFQTASSGGA